MGKGRIRYMNHVIRTACQAGLSLITAHPGQCTKPVALIIPYKPSLPLWSGGWGEGGLLSLANPGNIQRQIKHPGVTGSLPVPSLMASPSFQQLPNAPAELLFLNLISYLSLFTVWLHKYLCQCSKGIVCCCSGVEIRGQERHLFKAVLSLKPPFHQTLARD